MLAQANTCFVTASVWFDFSESDAEKKHPKTLRINQLDQLLISSELKRGYEYILAGESIDPTTATASENKLFALGFLKEYLLRKKELNPKD